MITVSRRLNLIASLTAGDGKLIGICDQLPAFLGLIALRHHTTIEHSSGRRRSANRKTFK